MALFARVWPAAKFTVEVPGAARSPGYTTTLPAVLPGTTVTFSDTDFAPDGSPHAPANVNVREAPAAIAGPCAPRVSTSRHGVRV